jgi:hypothetical protein
MESMPPLTARSTLSWAEKSLYWLQKAAKPSCMASVLMLQGTKMRQRRLHQLLNIPDKSPQALLRGRLVNPVQHLQKPLHLLILNHSQRCLILGWPGMGAKMWLTLI